MKFIYEKQEESKPLTLFDVEINQFFVKGGYLCQKEYDNTYVTIADPDGTPRCEHNSGDDFDTIDRILPFVKKIEF